MLNLVNARMVTCMPLVAGEAKTGFSAYLAYIQCKNAEAYAVMADGVVAFESSDYDECRGFIDARVDYELGEDVFDFTTARDMIADKRHPDVLNGIPDRLQSRLTFQISYVSRWIDQTIPTYWLIYLDGRAFGGFKSWGTHKASSPWLFDWHHVFYSKTHPCKTEADAVKLSKVVKSRIHFFDEYYWSDIDCGDAWFPSFDSLSDLLVFERCYRRAS